MRSFNKAILVGHLTRDPEARKTATGQSVTSFSIATNHVWNNAQTGERQESVDYHNIVAWGKLADTCAQYLRKGLAVLIEGRITNRTWEAQDGSKRNTTEIIAATLNILTPKGDAPMANESFNQDTNEAPEGVDIPVDDKKDTNDPQDDKSKAGKIDIDEILDF